LSQKTVLQFTSCHRLPERSFFWKGKQFPVCARCTGIHVGYISLFVYVIGTFSLDFWLSLALVAPTTIDGLTQAYMNRESTNFLRFTTGILFGIGMMSLVSKFGQWLGLLILQTI